MFPMYCVFSLSIYYVLYIYPTTYLIDDTYKRHKIFTSFEHLKGHEITTTDSNSTLFQKYYANPKAFLAGFDSKLSIFLFQL